MNKYVQNIVLVGMIIFGYMYGMDKKQSLSIVERTMIKKALSKISLNDNERVLHIDNHNQDIFKEKTSQVQLYSIDIDTLNSIEEPALTYDKIISFTCWNILTQSPQLFRKSVRLLKSTGQLCMIIPYNKSPYLGIYNQIIMSDKWQKICNQEKIEYYSRQKIKNLYSYQAKTDNNLICELIQEPFIFKSRKSFIQWIIESMQYLGNVFWWYHETLADDIADSYLKKYPRSDKDKSIQLYFPYMIISGCRS